MVKIIRYVLFPLALVYGLIVSFRNFLFNQNVLKSSEFDVKTILVGNLSAGGTGKTPHVEYLVRLLQPKYKLGTLSRGYGRKTHGFITADSTSSAKEIGDEPMQFKQKFNQLMVNVDSKRVNGIMEIMGSEFPPDVILMDDAYQHRSIKAGFSILLTDFNSPFHKDFMLPTGNLREFPIGKKRADVIVVTKCPENLSDREQNGFIEKLKPLAHQSVFFSKIQYGTIKSIWGQKSKDVSNNTSLLLVTGIANPSPLSNFLTKKYSLERHLNYPDHHTFTDKNIQDIISAFGEISAEQKIIITTEKDAMRLRSHEKLKELPIYYLEIEIDFISDKERFNNLIINYVNKD